MSAMTTKKEKEMKRKLWE